MNNATVIIFAAILGCWSALADASDAAAGTQAPFALVGDTILSRADFDLALSKTIRSRFYHGSIPEGELERVRNEVADDLVNRTLLLAEAERRGTTIDEAAIEATLDQYDRRYSNNPRWRDRRESMLSRLRQDLREEELLARLEEQVHRVAPPTRTQLEAYYALHPGEFTEPARMRVSLILLAVAPSSSAAIWQAAFEEAETLIDRLDDGADFAELARLRSADKSAHEGGDMGYLHEGMLAQSAQQALDALVIGAYTQPVRVLEGVAILQLTEKTLPQLRDFVDVRQRARELWIREQSEEAWMLLIEQLRNSTSITIYENLDSTRAI